MPSKQELLNSLSYAYKQVLREKERFKGSPEKLQALDKELDMFLGEIERIKGRVQLPSPDPQGIDVPFPEGVGRSAAHELGKLHRGIQEFDNKALKWLGLEPKNYNNNLTNLERQNVIADKQYEPYRQGNPVENIAGQILPYVIGSKGVDKAWPMVKGAAKIGQAGKSDKWVRRRHGAAKLAASPGVKATAEGGLFGAMHQDSDAVTGAALGFGGFKGGQALGGAFSRVPDELTKGGRRTVSWAQDKGFDLMPGLKSGNRNIQEVDRALATNMNTSDWASRIELKNRKIGTQLVAKKLGLDGVEELDEFAYREADKLISSDIEKIAQRISARLNVDDQVGLWNDIVLPFRQSGSDGQKAAAKKIVKQWNRIYKKLGEETSDRQGGRVLSGKQFQQIRRDFRLDIETGFSKNATTEQKAYAKGLLKIQDVLNKGVDRQGMMTEGAGNWSTLWREANQKMRILKDTQEALTRGNNKYDGLIDPNKLYMIYNRDYPELMASGKFFDNDLYELANLGNLTKTQSNASLQASQQLAKVLNSGRGDAKEGLAGLLALGSANAGAVGKPGMWLYKQGWPFTTGIANLPHKTKQSMAELGEQIALSGMGEDPVNAATEHFGSAASVVGDKIGYQYQTLKDAANAMRNWDKLKELEAYLSKAR